MIALFGSQEEAQRYCDERTAARGYPHWSAHPRTGEKRIAAAVWDVPRAYGDRWAAVWDEEGPKPDRAEIVERVEWRESPMVRAIKADGSAAAEAAKTETDLGAMSVLLSKLSPEDAAIAARENPDTDMQMALIQKAEEVLIWLKNRKS